ncbi:MAG: S-layer homology domain-containing protein [Actinobacteria bacterium]|nr:S-layer homology domain-containing protein [Actinomycetota bacterium]
MTTATRSPMTRIATLFVAVAAVLSMTGVAAEAAPRARTAPELRAEDIVLTLHGQARANPEQFGYAVAPVAPVAPWTDIREVARAWADRQASDQRMAHNPNFSTQLCCWTSVGENVAYITLRSLDDASVEQASRNIFQAWMDSTGHRNNILSGTFDQIGLGVSIRATATGYTMYLTTNFRKVTGTPPGSRYGTSGSGATTATAPAPSPYDSPACPEGEYDRGLFTDTVSGTHAGPIDCMAWWGIITRTDASGDVFGQHDVATRGFMAAVIARLAAEAGKPLPTPTRDHFDDDDGKPYEHAINRVAEAGIVGGFADGTFRPGASLSRAHMATFLANTYRDWLRLGSPDLADHFDDDRGSLHEDNINLVAQVDIAKGTGTRRFSPGVKLSRGQLASFAARTADHLVAAGVSPAGVN